MPPFIDLTGQRFGRWTVEMKITRDQPPTYWRCRCDCGSIGFVSTQNLRSHQSTSCGCRTVEATRKRSITHGATIGRTDAPEYKAWRQAKNRCYNPRGRDFPYYGGRGIKMADVWKNDYAAFRRDMGPRPKGYTLERIDSNGDYAPGNCRWATRYEQSNNTRQCVYLMHKGERMTMAQLATLYGVDYAALRVRIRNWRQTPEQAVFALLHGRKRRGDAYRN